MTKPLGERVARLEAYYAEIPEHLKEIKGHLARQNGHIDDLRRWKIQAQAVLGFMAFIVSVTAGTLLTLLATEVL